MSAPLAPVVPGPTGHLEQDVQVFVGFMEGESDHLWNQAAWARAMAAYYGKKTASLLATATGLSSGYVRQLIATANAFPDPSDRAQDLSFSHHRVAAMTEEPMDWIDRAVSSGWSVQDLKDAIQDAKDPISEADQQARDRQALGRAVKRYNDRWAGVTREEAVLAFHAVQVAVP
jgi:hypothetical protein